MFSKIWQIIAGALGILAAVLFAMQRITKSQKERAVERAEKADRRADTAEERVEQRQKADKASTQAKEVGDAHVEQVRKEARSGSRDHFSTGFERMRDDD